MSQSHKMDSSRAFLSSPFLRFVNVTCEPSGKEEGQGVRGTKQEVQHHQSPSQ